MWYEVLCVVGRKATVPQVQTLFERMTTIVMARGGVVRELKSLGTKQLAYPFRARADIHHFGRFFHLDLECSPATIELLNVELRNASAVIRSVTLRKKHTVFGEVRTRAERAAERARLSERAQLMPETARLSDAFPWADKARMDKTFRAQDELASMRHLPDLL